MSSILNNHWTESTTEEKLDFPKLKGEIKEEYKPKPRLHFKTRQKGMVKNTQSHYDNSKGSLYKWCEEKGLNTYEFDIIKRIMRCRKKGQFAEDLQKTKDLIDIYLSEYET
jgi:hypothetical protein